MCKQDCSSDRELARKVAFLSRPGTFSARELKVRETRMSWVFLCKDAVYKLKKPIVDHEVDLSTLEARHHNAIEEVRLNRRLAPNVYDRDPVPLTLDERGEFRLGGAGPVADWLVAMRRLPERLFLDRMIADGRAQAELVAAAAAILARFYRDGSPVTPCYAEIHSSIREGISRVGAALEDERLGLDRKTMRRRTRQLEERLENHASEIAERVAAGVFREGHGDLRPEHVCLTDPPVFIDCLEFDRKLRLVDPFDEIAYLGLECELLGAAWIDPLLFDSLERVFGQAPSRGLVGFYRTLRAWYRAWFALRHLLDPSPRTPGRWRPLAETYLAVATVEPTARCRAGPKSTRPHGGG